MKPRKRIKKKTTTLNLRIESAIKLGAEKAAKEDRRSVTGLVEYLIEQHCKSKGIDIYNIVDDEPAEFGKDA